MKLSAFVLRQRGPSTGTFLLLGAWDAECGKLLDAGWSGVHVGPFSDAYSHKHLVSVKAELGLDPHFRKMLPGHYERIVTLQEVINQWSGPFNLVWLNAADQNRSLWYTEQVQAILPSVCITLEDGHNEDVVKHAEGRGYWNTVVEDWLVMVHR